MIERIEWNHPQIGELPNPFMIGKYGRPLRITLHSDSLSELDVQEMAAVAVLRELGHLPEIELSETKPGDFPYIEIGTPDLEADIIPVQRVLNGMHQINGSITFPRQWPILATRLVGQSDPNHQDVQAMLKLITIAQAHYSLGGDILVTSSPSLLRHRNKTGLKEANPRTPLETAQIVGLFLRSRNNYTYEATSHLKRCFDRDGFYQILVHSRLPNMRKYISACRAAGKLRGDNLAELGESISIRCRRALEARDAIGVYFYMSQDNEIRERTSYHFDYLTVLLAGALDAQAVIANCAYDTPLIGSRVTFQNDDFNRRLKEREAVELYDLVTGQRFKCVSTLLHKLRNTIHEATLKTATYTEEGTKAHLFIIVPPKIEIETIKAAKQLGSEDQFGLIEKPFGMTFIEPYSYATTLVEECFDVINSVAASTDIEHLFPSGVEIPVFSEVPPADSPFNQAERIRILG